jgi:putative MATE family efflux protein
LSVDTDADQPAGTPAPDLDDPRIARRIFKLAWPLVIERLSISILSAVDAALVGHYVGADGLAAVGIGALLFWIVLSGAFAVDVASTAVIARDVGAGDRSRVQQGLHAAIFAALAWGLFCMAAMLIAAPWLFQVMNAEDDVVSLGARYLRAAALGFPMLMVLYAITGCLRGMGNTWLPMIGMVIINAVNALVSFLLISGVVADLGILAPGIGYACAGVVGGVMALATVASPISPVRIDLTRLADVTRATFSRLFRIGLPVGLEEAQFMLAFMVYTAIVARLGTTDLAAHSLALRSLEIAILPGFALGTAATALVGQYLGAQRPDLAEQAAKRTAIFATSALIVFAAVQFAMAPYIVRIFVTDQEVIDTGTRLLRVFAIALPALGLHASLSGVLRGAGDVRFVLATFTFTAWGVRVPVAAFMVIVMGLSAPFAWLAAVAENWTRAALVLRRVRQGRWKDIKV